MTLVETYLYYVANVLSVYAGVGFLWKGFRLLVWMRSEDEYDPPEGYVRLTLIFILSALYLYLFRKFYG